MSSNLFPHLVMQFTFCLKWFLISTCRRQKEKRINPACVSPLGFSSGSLDLPNGMSENMYTASLSSLPTSTQGSLAPFHPLALVGAGLSNVARAVNAATSHSFVNRTPTAT